MRYSQIKKSIVAQFAVPGGEEIRFLILGAPGGGKTSAAKDAMKELAPALGIAPDRQLFMHPSHLDTCDFLGLPELSGEAVRWVPPSILYNVREGTGPWAMILDEFTDSTMPVQNVLSGLLLERKVGDLRLDKMAYIICTGNRTEDKSGANRLSTKLGNRVRILNMDTHLDDWVEGFALPNGIQQEIIQFLRFKPNQLHDFEPNRPTNPTPRSWEKANLVPDTMDSECYFANVAGEVGEGAASEFIGFKRIYKNLPDLDKLLKDPMKAQVPTDPAILFAISGALAHKASPENFDAVLQYMGRLPKEFSVLTVKDAIILEKKLRNHKSYIQWATKNAEVLL